MLTRLLALILLGVSVGWSQNVAQLVRFSQVFNHITTAQASGPLVNVGAGNHLILVHFPTGKGTTSPIQVRIEASYDGVSFFPISNDITSVPLGVSGTQVYALAKANGTFPQVRVNSLTVTPGALPMDVWYTGAPFPIGNLFFDGDRWLMTGATAGYDKATFVICNGSACTVGNDLTNHYIVLQDLTVSVCYGFAKTSPTGQNLIVDIQAAAQGSGVFSSIFPAGNANKLNIGTTINTTFSNSTFALPGLHLLTRLRVDILQIGSGTAGQDVTVTCQLQF